MRANQAATALLLLLLLAARSSLAFPALVGVGVGVGSRQAGGVNICGSVPPGTLNGCIESAAVAQPLFFVCANNVQTVFTCDGGCRQQNAANLPTCDNGQPFTGSLV
ncbi:unnamed protein product [Discula destructiva]